MSSNIYFDNIQRYLLGYVDLIQSSNSLGLTNETIHAENLFAVILNMVFDWRLRNANQETVNQNSFDLVDSGKSIYVQVTSNKNCKRKYEKATSSFLQKYGDGMPKHFIVLFIAKSITGNFRIPDLWGNQSDTKEKYSVRLESGKMVCVRFSCRHKKSITLSSAQ